MEVDLQTILVAVISVTASSGFWAWVLRRSDRNSAKTQMMMGLAYIELMTLGGNYTRRGYNTRVEYEDLRKYFYEPYKALGGNGAAERMMEQVNALPFASYSHRYDEVIQVRSREGEYVNNGRVVTRPEEANARGS